ncbi:MAG: hypothetical protein ACTHW2_06570 [Tissierella sp.]|uniref:hypothetical protein n=1 Tax=Tissierella sp. TaxID=41274 RepID=UPI003F949526
MKKIMIALSLTLAVGLFSAFTYADSSVENQGVDMDYKSEESQQFREDRLQDKKDNLKNMVEKGFITEEDAKVWEEHYKYEDAFHEKNGYLNNRCGYGSNGGRRMGRNHMIW